MRVGVDFFLLESCIFFKIFDASKPEFFFFGQELWKAYAASRKKYIYIFFPGACISGELRGHFLSWAPKSTKPETHLPACSNASRTVVSAHQTFQAQDNVETSEDFEGKDLQGPRHDVPAQQCAGSQPAEGSVRYKRKMFFLLPLVPSKENFLFFPSNSPQGRFRLTNSLSSSHTTGN